MKIKNLPFIFLFFILIFFALPVSAAQIKVSIDGAYVDFRNNITPENIGGRVLVPARGVFETLGFDVQWDGENRRVTLSRHDYEIILHIDNTNFTVNGETRQLEVPAQILHGGSTYLPLRHPLEAIGYSLDWHDQTVRIFSRALTWVHGFYAFASFGQRELIRDMDPSTSVEDRKKIAMAFSFQNIGWFVDENNRVVSVNPIAVR